MAAISTWKIIPAVLLGIILLAGGMSPLPTAVAAPAQADATLTCSNAAQFVLDVTVPDNTIMRPGQAFTKTWRLRNTGTCQWDSRYKLVWDGGAALGGPASKAVAGSVWPQTTTDISVQLTAPTTTGTYVGTWQLADQSGNRFGPRIRVQIIVPNPDAGTMLPETLEYFGGGGGPVGCAVVPPRARVPLVTVEFPWTLEKRIVDVCVFGLLANSTVAATLRGPTGLKYSALFYVGEAIASADAGGDYATTVVEFPLIWPDNLPNGTWVLAVDDGRFHHETEIAIQQDTFQQPELRIAAGTSFSLFDTVEIVPGSHSYSTGEEITFLGYMYPAHSQIPLGIYREVRIGNDVRHELVDSTIVNTDGEGQFHKMYRIPASLGVGSFWAVAWRPDFDKASDDGAYRIIGLSGTRGFYVRAAPDSPLIDFSVSTFSTGDVVRVLATNLGRTSTRGGSITISSPDVTSLTIQDADVPILPASWSDCNIATPHAWVLTPGTPCHRALQYNTACKKTVNLKYPMAEAWVKMWSTGEYHELTVRVQPRAGARAVRLYARAAMLAGPSGCRIEISPQANDAGATDQQGFPVQVATMPVSQ